MSKKERNEYDEEAAKEFEELIDDTVELLDGLSDEEKQFLGGLDEKIAQKEIENLRQKYMKSGICPLCKGVGVLNEEKKNCPVCAFE